MCKYSKMLLALLVLAGARADAADGEIVVATALPVTYEIASALAEDTSIVVHNVPERGRRMSALGDLLERRGDDFEALFESATAVVTIGKLWPGDPLYTSARDANIRIVDIDATKPWSTSLEGVTVAAEPVNDVPWADTRDDATAARAPAMHFWQSPANTARAAEIVARDLMRLAPEEAAAIERNLAAYRRTLLGLLREYENRLATLANLSVVALAPEFVYLTNALGLYVDGHFFKQDIDWTDADLAALEAHLRERDVAAVLHKWEPDAPIREAIETAGAELIVLDTIDTGTVEDGRMRPDSYTRALRSNLEALYKGLSGGR